MHEVMDIFFFSSRRRHTRCGRDWSSDVCSSDLGLMYIATREYGVAMYMRPRMTSGVASLGRKPEQIGRASCREREEISEGAGRLKRKDDSSMCVYGG